MAETTELRGIAEKRVIARVLAGEREEFELLVLSHQERVYSIIRRMITDEDAAKELTQETFVRAYLNLSQFRFEASFSTWLIRIAINVTNNYFTSRQFKEQRRAVALEASDYLQIPADVAADKIEAEALEKLNSIIPDLSEKLRAVFVLCALDERTYEEAAAILNIPVGTVRSRLNKARHILRQRYFEA